MNVVRKLALVLFLAGMLTCAAISASPQDQPSEGRADPASCGELSHPNSVAEIHLAREQ